MLERELLLTGIGGQGVQFAARLVAEAAVRDGREVMLFGSYGGMMRGGNTDATIVVGDQPIESPPTVPFAWAAIVMHHDYWTFVRDRLRPGTLVLVDRTVFADSIGRDDVVTIDIPATDIAVDLGQKVAATTVMVGALSAITGLVSAEALHEAVAGVLPSYRSRHIEVNQQALQAGVDAAAPADRHPCWERAWA